MKELRFHVDTPSDGSFAVFVDDDGNKYRIWDNELELVPRPLSTEEDAILKRAREIQMRRGHWGT